MSVLQSTLDEAWKVFMQPFIGTNATPNENSVAFVRQINNDSNSTVGSPYINIDLESIKNDIRFQNSSRGKKDIISRARYYKQLQPSLLNPAKSSFCDLDAPELEEGQVVFSLKRFTSQRVKLPTSICKEGTHAERAGETMRQLVKAAVEKFGEQVAMEFFNPANGYIGALPKRGNALPPRPAGSALPLFHPAATGKDPALNLRGIYELDRDKEDGQVPNSRYMVGSGFAKMYKQAFEMQGFRDDGYNYSEENSPFDVAVYTNQLAKYSGLPRPILFIPNGYVKLVTIATNTDAFGNRILDGDHVRTTVPDPFLGLDWDLHIYRETCGENVEYSYSLSLLYGIVAMPVCDNGDPALEGVNGIYLYNGVCSEDSICDIDDLGYNKEVSVSNKEVCETVEIPLCDSECKVSLTEIAKTDTALFLQAIFNVSQGATLDSISWTVDGDPSVENANKPVGEFLLSGLTDGDEIVVTVVDSLGCEATFTYTYKA